MPEKKRNPITTLAICLSCLVCGIPVAGVLISLEITFMPPMPLKDPNTIINSPHIALFAAAFISIASSVIVMLGSVVLRHMSPNNVIVGLITFGFGAGNFIAQLVILALVYISNSVHPEVFSRTEVQFVNGQYDANGKQFTRETWSCMMGNLYLDREPWSTNACSEYHYARYCTILFVNTAFLLLTIAYWPVRNFLFAGSRQSAVMAQGKAGYDNPRK
ncbi:uncharacterized protein BDR25DRAFT_342496 [Lindgomyces ingoldianus]|uniref:Uncharacterized protein n=1 Tax=Lindgomyces ingoldianus TaxID=673940 RepID=A0ACB6QY63_9PLEO|nr:uncharacterized protein BDR25DRAFT_342496 [Lindgomyces ingoldianus]KAF2471141.1 hypothetical protein BDR25DRAFT_342496 [Lindgomyces ingoldianus]